MLVLRTVSGLCTRFRAYHSQPRKNRLTWAGFLRRAIYAVCGLAQPPDQTDILRGSYLISEQSSASSQTAPSVQTPRYHTTPARVCQGVFLKFLPVFPGITLSTFGVFAKKHIPEPRDVSISISLPCGNLGIAAALRAEIKFFLILFTPPGTWSFKKKYYFSFQISSLYCWMVRSEEKNPDLAMFTSIFLAQARRSP